MGLQVAIKWLFAALKLTVDRSKSAESGSCKAQAGVITATLPALSTSGVFVFQISILTQRSVLVDHKPLLAQVHSKLYVILGHESLLVGPVCTVEEFQVCVTAEKGLGGAPKVKPVGNLFRNVLLRCHTC